MPEDELQDMQFDDAGDLHEEEDWLDAENNELTEDDWSMEDTEDLENVDLDIEMEWDNEEDLSFLEEED